jgi:hypothetical protein
MSGRRYRVPYELIIYARAGVAFFNNISKYAWNQVPASGAGLKAEALPQKPS